MALTLFEHNQRAFEAAQAMLNETGKAAVIHPTGTGKSYVAFRLAWEKREKRFLWLSPSEYIFQTQLERARKEDPAVGENITFLTYARLMQLSPRALAALDPAYIILDEFHRCGAEKWGAGVRDLLQASPGAKVLGLSATHVRYLDNQRDMAQELFDGCVASEMTLGEAIVRGILPAPKYVTTVYAYSGELKKYEARVERLHNPRRRAQAEEYLDALRRALEMSEGLEEVFAKHIPDRNGKYLVFCASFEHLRQMRENAKVWFGKVDDNPRIYTAYSSDPETSKAFARFKEDDSGHLKLLFCIDMLNEGVHVEGVDGVVLFRPTVSPIIYKQQIGRALSAGSRKAPVIFDIVNNFENLYSISSIQTEMYEAACRFYGNDQAEELVKERFRIIDQVRPCREIFGELQRCMDAGWDSYYTAARAFYEKAGNLDIPKRYKSPEGLALGDWLFTQRKIRAGLVEGKLSDQQIKKLDDLGMEWGSVRELAWARAYEAARNYYEEYGNLLVPSGYVTPDGQRLGDWINRQRNLYATSGESRNLPRERVEKLNAIGMVWSAVSHQWERNYAQAARYYAEHGDLEVSAEYETEDGFRLGNWVNQLRQTRNGTRQGKALTGEQIQRLDAIGMRWGSHYDGAWMSQYENARLYFRKHGDLDVPARYLAPDGSALGKWISRQRSGKKELSAERIRLLDQIGMNWGTDSWTYRFALAQDYIQAHGTSRIPSQYRTPDGIWLGKWLYQQKKAMEEPDAKLSEHQRDLLRQLLA